MPYPDDLVQRVRRLELLADRLFTAINTQAAQMQIGSDGGPRIRFGIGADDLPEARFYPTSGPGYARIVAGGTGGAGIEVIGEADASGNRYSMLIDKDNFKVFFWDSTGTQAEGTMLQATSVDGATGFLGTSLSEQNFWSYEAARTTHVGTWSDGGAGSYWGILTGSGSTSGTFATLTYPVTMASTMNPVIGFQSPTADSNWCITASSTTGMTVSRSTSGPIDLYYWIFRT